jgi:hypothetical protein
MREKTFEWQDREISCHFLFKKREIARFAGIIVSKDV